jgi:hypothetical protein
MATRADNRGLLQAYGKRADGPRWEYHTISTEGHIDPAQLSELGSQGWEMFSVAGPVSADDRRRDYHFRRVPFDPNRLVTITR